MKKGLVLAIFIAFLIPSVASAAWWNPFSWKIFSKFFSTRPIETQVEQVPEADSDSKNQSLEIEKLKEELETLRTQASESEKRNEQKVVPQATKPPVQENIPKSVVTPVAPQTYLAPVVKSGEVLYDELIQKYTVFKSYLESEKRSLNKNSQYISEREYYTRIDDLLNRTSGDLGYLQTVKNWDSIPPNIEYIYLTKFDSLKSEHNREASLYLVELNQDKMRIAKKNVVDYIKENKLILYQIDVHIKAAALLYLFDQLFNTNYSPDFESKKTQQENIEFANRFLIDQGESIID